MLRTLARSAWLGCSRTALIVVRAWSVLQRGASLRHFPCRPCQGRDRQVVLAVVRAARCGWCTSAVGDPLVPAHFLHHSRAVAGGLLRIPSAAGNNGDTIAANVPFFAGAHAARTRLLRVATSGSTVRQQWQRCQVAGAVDRNKVRHASGRQRLLCCLAAQPSNAQDRATCPRHPVQPTTHTKA
eukprot:scaffold547_cov384-Prasinococcus_capsulatus_cf.AAC.43